MGLIDVAYVFLYAFIFNCSGSNTYDFRLGFSKGFSRDAEGKSLLMSRVIHFRILKIIIGIFW